MEVEVEAPRPTSHICLPIACFLLPTAIVIIHEFTRFWVGIFGLWSAFFPRWNSTHLELCAHRKLLLLLLLFKWKFLESALPPPCSLHPSSCPPFSSFFFSSFFLQCIFLCVEQTAQSSDLLFWMLRGYERSSFLGEWIWRSFFDVEALKGTENERWCYITLLFRSLMGPHLLSSEVGLRSARRLVHSDFHHSAVSRNLYKGGGEEPSFSTSISNSLLGNLLRPLG